jgi:hypothetical protein
MEPHALELDEDGVFSMQPDTLALGAPPRRHGTLPETPEQISSFSPDRVPVHWLLEDLASGARRDELESLLARATPAFARAIGHQLAMLDLRGEEPRAYLAALVERAPTSVRETLRESALETARLRREDMARVAAIEAEPLVPRPFDDAERDALLDTIWNPDGGEARRDALDRLSARARPIAVELASTLLEDGELARRARALLAFPTRESLHAALTGLGLTPHADGFDLVSSLRDRTDTLWLKTSVQPVGHDHVMTSWKRLAPTLGHWLFEEWPALHPDDPATDDGRLHFMHRLRAFDGTHGLEARLVAEGSWLDVQGLVAFANTLLARTDDETRFVVVEERGEHATVLAAPRQALRALARLALWDPPRH